MNISKETIKQLESEFSILFYDNNANIVKPENATELSVIYRYVGENIELIHKTIKATKKETTYDYVLNKINSESVYKDFSVYFNQLVKKYSFSAYPTTYGIGVFIAVGFRESINKAKHQIENELNNLGIKFTTEYSNAMYVFRYKISKEQENVNRIKKILNK